jgi:hypothetical protein
MTNWKEMWNQVVVSYCEILSQYFPGETKTIHETNSFGTARSLAKIQTTYPQYMSTKYRVLKSSHENSYISCIWYWWVALLCNVENKTWFCQTFHVWWRQVLNHSWCKRDLVYRNITDANTIFFLEIHFGSWKDFKYFYEIKGLSTILC